MGMDIAFDHEKAVAAGMQIRFAQNGTPEDIEHVRKRILKDPENDPQDKDFLNWLESYSYLVQIPGTDWWVEDTGVDKIVVRANKWGRTYEPLTKWLKENNISWSEF